MPRAVPQADLVQLWGYTGSHLIIVAKLGEREIATIALGLEEARELATNIYALADECEERATATSPDKAAGHA